MVSVSGLVDERFQGLGDVAGAKSLVVDISRMTRMTSFGVRQWLKAMSALPKAIPIYLVGCPTFFVDQLNMVLNFGGAAKVLTVVAPYTCTSCGVESGEVIDVLREGAALTRGSIGDRQCQRCSGKLEFDETPESYFAFVTSYMPTGITPGAAELLRQRGLYHAAGLEQATAEKPPRIIKVVHGTVTYFRIIGTLGTGFRARPMLVGAEGEIVIDVAEVERVAPGGIREWRRLLATLVRQVPAVTLVDVGEAFLASAADSLSLAPNVAVASVLVPHRCVECDRASQESVPATWPLGLASQVCPICGGQSISNWDGGAPADLAQVNMTPPPASAKVIAQRAEILSRALTDANVAQAGESVNAQVNPDDTILGKYKIIRKLSAGGMAEVFLAKQMGMGGFEKPVALKRIQHNLLHSRHLAVDMFLDEAKIAGRLMHPNIVQVLDVGEMQGALYLAMEYVRGKDLREVLKHGGPMPLGETCYVIREVAQALQYAYWSNDMTGRQLAVVHRDVSPQNIILGTDGSVKLLDFGVAMSAVTEHTRNTIVGKWLYMSPEAMSNKAVDHRSDLFSLGVVLYLATTGNLPFTGREPKEIVRKMRAREFVPLQERAQVPDELARLVARMLSPDPSERPSRGQDVVAALTDIARRYGIDSSGPRIAEFLVQRFPEELATPEPVPIAAVQELVMSAYDRPMESAPPLNKLASGSIPVARGSSPYASGTPAEDVSDTGVTTVVPQDGRRPSRSSHPPVSFAHRQQVAIGSANIPAPRPPMSMPMQAASPLPPPQQLSPLAMPPAPQRSSSLLIVLITVLVVLLGFGMYVLLRLL